MCCREYPHFNPTMVRLKLSEETGAEIIPPPFQSHNGSIKTLQWHYPDILYHLFQSHNGSIKTFAF